jgi:hypothetical protein
MGKGGGIVSGHEGYEATKIGSGANSGRNPGMQQCIGCAGARAMARQNSARTTVCVLVGRGGLDHRDGEEGMDKWKH